MLRAVLQSVARTRALALALALLCTLVGHVPRASASAARAPTVILLSLDGVRFDQIDGDDLPAFGRMLRDGARAERLEVVFPSLTFPSHVSLATGTPPDRHGIVMNSFDDVERGRFHYGNDASWLEAEPLWAAAERQSVRAAVFFWVGSETPWHGVAATYRRAPFDEGIDESTKVAAILAWLDLPEAERPRLVMSWWHGTDSLAHRLGPDAPRVRQRLRQQDRALGELLSGIDARGGFGDLTLIVVSDHGMADVDEPIDAMRALRAAGLEGRITVGGGMAQLRLADRAQQERALAVLRAIEGVRAEPRDALPPEWRYAHATRVGDIVLVTEPPRVFVDPGAAPTLLARLLRAFSAGRGAHGYEPTLREMGAIFVALGRGVPAGARLGTVRAIDVAATASSLLGIAPPAQNEGQVITGLGDGRSRDGSAASGEGGVQ
jgi:arylsulfatase A-like enzyme